MAWSRLMRGSILLLGRIRSQNPATLNGRAWSSTFPSQPTPPPASPYPADSYEPYNDYSDDDCEDDSRPEMVLTQEQILEASAATIHYARDVINRKKQTGIVYRALSEIWTDPIFDTWDLDARLHVLHAVLHRIRKYPNAKPLEVFLMDIYIKSMSYKDEKDITKDEVISRVLEVIQSYPKVGSYKVTEETHFANDLGFEFFDYQQIWKALYLEFKLDIPVEVIVSSCKKAIDYIYENRMKRQGLQDFQKANMYGDIFWPLPPL